MDALKITHKKRKMKILNSLIVPKILNGGYFGIFNIHVAAKFRKTEEGPFADIKIFSKKVSQSRNNIEQFSKKPYIRYTLYPVCDKSGLRQENPKRDPFVKLKNSLARFTALKNSPTLYPVYVTAYKAYKICLFVGLKKTTSRERPKSAPHISLKIAIGLQIVKNSLLQYLHEEKIQKIHISKFFWSPINRIVPKNVEGDLKKAYLTSISNASRSSVAFSVSSS